MRLDRVFSIILSQKLMVQGAKSKLLNQVREPNGVEYLFSHDVPTEKHRQNLGIFVV